MVSSGSGSDRRNHGIIAGRSIGHASETQKAKIPRCAAAQVDDGIASGKIK